MTICCTQIHTPIRLIHVLAFQYTRQSHGWGDLFVTLDPPLGADDRMKITLSFVSNIVVEPDAIH